MEEPVLQGLVEGAGFYFACELAVKFDGLVEQVFDSFSVKGRKRENRSPVHMAEHGFNVICCVPQGFSALILSIPLV